MSQEISTHKKLLWLDCDPGHDDAMAIYMAARAENIKLLGIDFISLLDFKSTLHMRNRIFKVSCLMFQF